MVDPLLPLPARVCDIYCRKAHVNYGAMPVPPLVAEAAGEDGEEEEKEQSCNAPCHCMGLKDISSP